jgi:exonuclease III
MVYTYKIAMLNINAMKASIRIKMLEQFLNVHDIELLCAQEITNNIQMIRNYTVHTNIGTEGRGTAITDKHIYNLTDIRLMPSGRGIVATFNGIQIVNICVHSGAGRKRERENFSILTSLEFSCVPQQLCCLRESLIAYCKTQTVRERHP